jgi:hypothetical protein
VITHYTQACSVLHVLQYFAPLRPSEITTQYTGITGIPTTYEHIIHIT